MSKLLKYAKINYSNSIEYRDPADLESFNKIENEKRDEILTNAILYQSSSAWLSEWYNTRVTYYTAEKDELNRLIKETSNPNHIELLREQRNLFSRLAKKYKKGSDKLLKASEVYEEMLMKKVKESESDKTESIHNVLIDIFARMGTMLANNNFSSEAKVAILNPTDTVIPGSTIFHGGKTYLPIIG